LKIEFHLPACAGWRFATKLFNSEQTLHLNGQHWREYYPHAHTDSDVSVHFTDADIIHVATLWNGHFPFIDYSTGGSIDGMIRAAGQTSESYGQDHRGSRTWAHRQQVSTDRIPRHVGFGAR
jgi:hypothetical protein